ncbi:MAG TPA: 16S rRNA (cytosine(967)-C(5))-methyltransferase RsmB [Burkholderiales bacterium]|nr:16S rRNA (cytosine(967)-C(5))-methyltransferase RsmB [Burkholderiales bacterium]
MTTSIALSATFVHASEVLAGVYGGQSLSELDALPPAVRDLCYSALRDYGYADAVLAPLLRKPIAETKIRALLACALREIERSRTQHFTVVNEAVAACPLLGHPAAKGFVNAVLRNYLRQRETLENQASAHPVARWRHPQWWIESVQGSYPQHWQQILAAGNERPPMSLRVNRRKTDPHAYKHALDQAGMAAFEAGNGAFVLDLPRAVDQIPGFSHGLVSVQDVAAQYAATLLDAQPGMRVLDACAAPGGKTAHILEQADVDMLALDRDERRAGRIHTNMERLGLSAAVRVADAGAVPSWWDGISFDRVLLDAPCTASGVVRRHPDIKWLRQVEDISRFAAQQKRLLDALWQVVAPSGKLLYVTCSVFPQENAMQIDAFLARHENARRLPLPAFMPAEGQLLPDARHDGFFYALLQKQEAP